MEYFNPTFDQNPQLKKHRQNIYQLTQGDIIAFRTTFTLPDGTPATPDNCKAKVAMEDRRFSQDKLWVGEWRNGLKPVDGREGLVEVRVPDSVSSLLRDGAYVLSVSLSSRDCSGPYEEPQSRPSSESRRRAIWHLASSKSP